MLKPKKELNILFYDHNWSQIARLVDTFAALVQGSDIHVVLLSERQPSSLKDNLEIIHINDIPQKLTMIELQSKYAHSLHRALVPERAYYDYSSFRKSECYSSLSEDEIAIRITPHLNALDYLVRERIDLVIEWFPDNFISSVVQMIAANYTKKCAILLPHYWWSDGALIIDRMNMTSTVIDKHYKLLYEDSDLLSKQDISYIDSRKQTFLFKQSEMYQSYDRLKLMINRQNGYQPVSLKNWFVRRSSRILNRILIKVLVKTELHARDERFVVYPLHISPEAAMLGTAPELADQFGLIKNISMNLPYGVKLYVKQHPYEDIGAGLNYDFYRRLSSLPNVRIFNWKSKLDSLIDHSGFVAMTILAGTSAIDAALKKKPVFLFGCSYFSVADCFIKPSNFQDFFVKVTKIINGDFEFDEQGLRALLGALDSAVAKANVDISAQKDITDIASLLPFIWQSYVESEKETMLHHADVAV